MLSKNVCLISLLKVTVKFPGKYFLSLEFKTNDYCKEQNLLVSVKISKSKELQCCHHTLTVKE